MVRFCTLFLKVSFVFLCVFGSAVRGTDQHEIWERLSILEEKIQDLTGQVEEMSHSLNTQKKSEESEPQAPNDNKLNFKEKTEKLGAGSGAAVAAIEAPPQNPGSNNLPDDGVQDLYNKALSFLSHQDYDAAQAVLKRILEDHKGHPLVINAQYWLGECYLQRQKDEKDGTAYLEKAMSAFADAYKSYRLAEKSTGADDAETRRVSFAKAPEALLKLAITLKLLGRTKDACASLNQLSKEFPLLPQNLKKLKESTGAGICG